ncbi:hypothetical protein RhiirB3_427775 [Rhizophagus irregularis]|nr:hypothetical protein RhiirB3_427775 [Rhizophagus irregularis]
MGNITSKHRMKLKYESHKLNAELHSQESRRNYELQIKKADIELMIQMKDQSSDKMIPPFRPPFHFTSTHAVSY